MPERSPITRKLLEYLPERQLPWWQGLLLGIASAGVAYLLRVLIDPLVAGVPFVTFFPLLVVATFWGGLWGGTSALLLGAVIGAYAWLTPERSLAAGPLALGSAMAFLVSGGTVVLSVYIVNEALAALRRSEARAAMIAGEMQHRVKNVLQLVNAISRLTAGKSTTVEEHQARFSERIQALAMATEAVRKAPHLPVDLEELLRQLLQPFGLSRFTLAGPPVSLNDETGSSLGLAVHELATNAMKYGALHVPTGSVSVRWKHDGAFVEIEWQEQGGPEVAPPCDEGFGSKLLRSAFTADGGSTELSHELSGLRCRFRCPRTV